jgi:hypothetical protein
MSYKKYKDIGDYIVYRDGRVLSKKKGILLKPVMGKGKNKYYTVKVPRRIALHRLVAIHFCQNKNNKPHVNHFDGDKTNNHASNLRWCTFYENIKHANKNGLMRNKRGQSRTSKLSTLDVSIVKEARSAGFKYTEIGKYFNVHPSTIRHININA